jgi:L-aspartate oxidase
VEREHEATGEVVLDVSPLDFEHRFPDLAALCAEHGVDPSTGIPVVPAEHFLCGGIDVDDRGRTTLDRLYAVGECARTGVHGANRLASTSLLEGLVWGLRAGTHAADRRPNEVPADAASTVAAAPSADRIQAALRAIRQVMDVHVSLRRRQDGLREAVDTLQAIKADVEANDEPFSRPLAELRSAATVGLLVARAALENETSVGCHYRVDAPATNEAPLVEENG